jgi:hypothetical protein
VLAALLLLTRIPVHGSYLVHLLPALLVCGAGGGLTLPALATLGMSGATDADAGLVSGLFNTTQQVGAAIGVALLSTVAAGRTTSLLGAHESTALALTAGYRLAFTVGAAMSGAALALAAALLRRPRAAAVHPGAVAIRPRAAAINETGPAQRIPQPSACAATGQTAAPTNSN